MVWDATLPIGSEAISNGDNRIRELKTDIATALSAQGSFPGADTSNPKYKWIPERDTTGNRPSTSLVTGQLYLNTTTTTLQRYNGATWDDMDMVGALAITTAKIAASAVDENKIATSVAGAGLTGGGGSALSVVVDDSTIEINVDTLRVKASGITANELAANSVGVSEIATAIAGNGLGGGGGSALSVNVDNSSIEISGDSLQVKAGGITEAMLASAVTAKLSAPKSIQRTSQGISINMGSVADVTKQGTANKTITAVTENNSYVIIEGVEWTTTGDAVRHVSCKAQLSSTTNVAVSVSAVAGTTPANETPTFTVYFTVVEWN